MVNQIAQTLGLHIHTVDFPIRGFENAFGEVMTDKTIHAK